LEAHVADEIVLGSIGDLSTTEVLGGDYLLLLADRNALPNHPALMYVGDVAGRGSNVIKVPHIGLFGYDLAATGTEGVDVANTALTDSSSTVTVVQKSKVYQASDAARIIDAQGLIRMDTFAVDAVATSGATLLSMIANLVDNFATTVGTTTVDATFANFLECIATLEIAKVQGPYLGMFHPRQWADIRADVATASGGAIQFNAGSQALLDAMKGLGLQGSFCGVDVFTTTHVPTANGGADRAGGMFGRGAILWADGTVPVESDPNQMILADKVLFERIRSGRAGLTAYATHRYVGAAEGIDLAGVSLITDA
jgi:hypothetical protein